VCIFRKKLVIKKVFTLSGLSKKGNHFSAQGGNIKATKLILTRNRWVDEQLNYQVAPDVNIDKTFNYRCQPKTQLVLKLTLVPIVGCPCLRLVRDQGLCPNKQQE
jgi:hypothetical protein